MTLEAFRAKEALTIQQLADLLGVTGPWARRTVHRYLTYQRIPDRVLMRVIEKKTGGKVTSGDFPDSPVRRTA